LVTLNIAGSDVSVSSCEIQIYDVVSEPRRDVKGTLITSKLAQKVKLVLTNNLMTSAELQTLLGLFELSFYFDVQYHDPKTNSMRTCTCYPGDRSCKSIKWYNNEPTYIEWKISLIEV
jgi:hypothetical protein